MPIFDIHCRDCGHQGELLVLSAQSSLICPNCDGLAVEMVSGPPPRLQ
jgi:putative FmdB family regulatory protein